MKKIVLSVLLAFMFVFTGCKSNSATTTKVDYKIQRVLKGNWQITSVTFPGSDVFKVTSFGIEDSKCFVGSNWKFVANNNKGNFALTQCSGYQSDITWFINKDGDFVMKILDETKAKKVKEGYVLKTGVVSDNSFQLLDKINIAGKTANVVYQFEKVN